MVLSILLANYICIYIYIYIYICMPFLEMFCIYIQRKYILQTLVIYFDSFRFFFYGKNI